MKTNMSTRKCVFFLLIIAISCSSTHPSENKLVGNQTVESADTIVDMISLINQPYKPSEMENKIAKMRSESKEWEYEAGKEYIERLIRDWLYGNWEYRGYDEWIGRYTSYVSITENNLRWGYNGKESYCGPYEINQEDSKIYFNQHNGFSTYIKFDFYAERLVNDDGRYFTKVSDLNGNSNSNNYGRSSHNSSCQNNVIQFRNDYDVINYTSSHTFRNNVGNNVKINLQGMYVNGSLVTNVPRVLNFNGSSATISVTSPYTGGGTMIISVDASRGIITDGSGDVFWMVN